MKRLSDHLRSNVVAYLALFVALGGTSYAAVSLPSGSVGTRQLRNHSVTPSKLGRIGAVVRYWAVVNGSGRVLDSGSVRPQAGGGGGNVNIAFKRHNVGGRCFVLGSLLGSPGLGVGATFELFGNDVVRANTSTSTSGVPATVAVAVLCSP